MNITYIITKKVEEEINNETINSVNANVKKGDCIVHHNFTSDEFDKQIYSELKSYEKDEHFKDADYIVVIPNNSTLEPTFRKIVEEYVDDSNTVYLPFTLLIAENNTKGLLNTSMWTNHALEVGLLDHELALMQADTILFGAIIPKEIFFSSENYNEDLKYFQHYYFINSVTNQEDKKVIGIPKLLINLDYDLTFNHIDKDEKVKNYKLAREKFVKELHKEELVVETNE